MISEPMDLLVEYGGRIQTMLALALQPAPDDDVPALPADHRGVRVHPPRLQVGQVQDPHVRGQQVSIHTNSRFGETESYLIRAVGLRENM